MIEHSTTRTEDPYKSQRSSSFPRISELLAGAAMPSASSSPTHSLAPQQSFQSELPRFSEPSPPQSQSPHQLPPLPVPSSLAQAVASAMEDPPVPMPAPLLISKPVQKTNPFIEPFPTSPSPAATPKAKAKATPATPVAAPDLTPIIPTAAPASVPTPAAVETPSPSETPSLSPEPSTKQEPSPPLIKGQDSPAPATRSVAPQQSPSSPTSPRKSETEEKTSNFSAYQETLPGFEDIERNLHDAQLVEALLPIVESSLEKALYAPKTGLHMYLEPMLRATVRRAIAEQMQTIHHFGQISLLDRIAWRLKALLTSRTYDDIVFERTHRYRVEEVYLLRYQSNSLISYASHDPSRHSTPRKIKYDLARLVEELNNGEGELQKSFELPNQNTAVVRCGQNCFLLASIRGPINALVRADLDYVLSQVEQRFGERLRDQGQHFIHVLQPLLEGCLLIQSPPPPR